jgi:hypothetical protein
MLWSEHLESVQVVALSGYEPRDYHAAMTVFTSNHKLDARATMSRFKRPGARAKYTGGR